MSIAPTITIAENTPYPLTVNRLGYGTMRLTGPGIYGEPPNRAEALKILKEAVSSGVQFFDTADYYGEDVTNRLIKEVLYPYSADTVICTKVGATRRPDKSWIPFNSAANIRTAIEQNLRTLKIDQVQLVHCRVMPGSEVPFSESMEAMFSLQAEGKILHVGVSNVTPAELQQAMAMGNIATVENMYGHAQRSSVNTHYGNNRGGEEVMDLCMKHELPLIPYFSLANALPKNDERIQAIAAKYNATPAQVNIAWLLHVSPLMLPIPGTTSLLHFKENMQALNLQLSGDDMAFLS